MQKLAIVGAGQAAATLIHSLQAQGYSGDIALFGNEATLPYERPPLSKNYLLGKSTLGPSA